MSAKVEIGLAKPFNQDCLGELRRKKSPQPGQAFELIHLLIDTFFKLCVPLSKLCALRLHGLEQDVRPLAGRLGGGLGLRELAKHTRNQKLSGNSPKKEVTIGFLHLISIAR